MVGQYLVDDATGEGGAFLVVVKRTDKVTPAHGAAWHGTSLSLSAAASGAITSQSCFKAALACSVLETWHQ